MKKKIGLYGGTFDPIHFGHINLAINVAEAHKLDEVLFCPAAISPHKQDKPPSVSLEHRIKMAQLGIEGIKNFRVIDYEACRPGPSYTIDTIEELNSLSSSHYYLIIGDDMIQDFPRWHRYKDILKMSTLLVGSRYPQLLPPVNDPILSTAIHSGTTKIPIMEISSTEIRSRLKKRLYIGHLVPGKVVDYIYQNDLYYK
jgi:nicotinate-nucleotide adenylyltransferase